MRKYQYIHCICISSISPHSNGTGSWNLSLRSRMFVLFNANIMAVDDLEAEGARASTDIVFIYFYWNILVLVSARPILNLTSHTSGLKPSISCHSLEYSGLSTRKVKECQDLSIVSLFHIEIQIYFYVSTFQHITGCHNWSKCHFKHVIEQRECVMDFGSNFE